MTRAEALAEARRRWGARAFARETSWAPDGSGYEVGSTVGGWGPAATPRRYGHSEVSWEAAFADADRRAGVEVLPNGIRLTVRR